MNRRAFISGVGAATAVGLAGAAALAQDEGPAGAHPGHADVKVPARPKEVDAVLASTEKCQSTGSVCLSHCSYWVLSGDAKMAECQRAVMNMLAVTQAMHGVAGYNSAGTSNLASLAKTCADFCRACEKACQPHADHHPECKACMEACHACAQACDALVQAT
jgi:Cys-rich four helix bundle protein (predicted Tat secretion target)